MSRKNRHLLISGTNQHGGAVIALALLLGVILMSGLFVMTANHHVTARALRRLEINLEFQQLFELVLNHTISDIESAEIVESGEYFGGLDEYSGYRILPVYVLVNEFGYVTGIDIRIQSLQRDLSAERFWRVLIGCSDGHCKTTEVVELFDSVGIKPQETNNGE